MDSPRINIMLVGFETDKARRLRQRIWKYLDQKKGKPKSVVVAIIPGEVKAWPIEPGDKMAPYVVVRGTVLDERSKIAEEIREKLWPQVEVESIGFLSSTE